MTNDTATFTAFADAMPEPMRLVIWFAHDPIPTGDMADVIPYPEDDAGVPDNARANWVYHGVGMLVTRGVARYFVDIDGDRVADYDMERMMDAGRWAYLTHVYMQATEPADRATWNVLHGSDAEIVTAAETIEI